MDRITAAEVFVTIVDRGSMIAAAETLEMSRAMVTRYLAQMEQWAGARLLHRTTRKLSLTDAGERTLEGCRQMLALAGEIDLVEEGLFGVDADRKNHMFEVFIQIHSRIKLNGEFRLQDGSVIAYRQVEPEKAESLLGLQFEVMEDDLAGAKSLRVMMTYRQDHYSQEQANLIADGVQHVFT
ncbi:LysR family transcriptional regulator, partial [Morganella morganii]|uniref:LysR family transcriptional regulator n=1 Tax=Morganella morganii TaxID=582 RepID=UPI002712AB4F